MSPNVSAVRRRRRRRRYTPFSAVYGPIFAKFAQNVYYAKSSVRAENWTCSLKTLHFLSKIQKKIDV